MKKILNLLCSLLLITSFHSYGADFAEKPYEEIELVNGTKVPKTYEHIIKKLFTLNSYYKPGHCVFRALGAVKNKCKNSYQYEVDYTHSERFLYENDARRYSLHPEENAPYACNILDAIFNSDPALRLDPNEYINSEDFTTENWEYLGVSFPIKQVQD